MAADPLAGDPGAITKLSSALADHQDDIRTGAHQVVSAQHDADGWEGASKDRFTTTIGTIAPAAQRIISRLDLAIDVLDTYAEAVRQIQDEAERIQAAQLTNAVDSIANAVSMGSAQSTAAGSDATEADVRRVDSLQTDADDLAAAAKRLDAEWDALVERRAAADHAAAAGLTDSEVTGVAVGYAGSLAAVSDADFLRAVAGMPPEVLAAQGNGVTDRIAGMPPEIVQAWWDGLGGRGTAGVHSAAQDALITALPAVIGNLNGVPYWARDQANRLSAQRAYVEATEALGAAQETYGKAVGRAAQAVAHRALIAAQERYDQLNNFVAGARTDLNLRYPMSRQMVAFRDGEPPLGAFSVGDLDSASSVTFLVPGMGSSLADTTQYMRTGSTVQQSQQQMSGDASAYVTWLGYEAPPNFVATGDTAVLHEDSARVGAANLGADLAAVRATRPDVQLNVVAHSYGSTTAAIALADDAALRIHSFVTLGSAGIPSSVPDAGATHAAHMYAAQADEKWDIAAFGRTFSDPHRADPTQGFGATEMQTDGSKTVKVHDLAADPDSRNVGYLDSGTKTLLGTAKATMP